MSVNAAQNGQQSQSAASNGANPPGVAPAAGQNPGMDDMFMKLLLAQIQNQNPLDPTDASQFVSQLAQMSQMKSSADMLKQLQGNALMLRELQGVSLGSQVGRQVLVQADQAHLSGKDALSGRVTLSGEEQQVSLVLTDAGGKETVIELGKRPAGEFDFSVDPSKHGLVEGDYKLEVRTASKSKAGLEMQATVSGVRLPINGGEPTLTLAGLGEFPASAITRLLGKTQA